MTSSWKFSQDIRKARKEGIKSIIINIKNGGFLFFYMGLMSLLPPVNREFSNRELSEITEITHQGKDIQELLEEKLAPFKEKISQANGQLITALTRRYESRSCGMRRPVYGLETMLYTGIVTPETKFHGLDDHYSFLLGIKNAHYLDLSSEIDFRRNEKGNFGIWVPSVLTLLYFMERPPVDPESLASFFEGILKPKPRLELYIGDQEAIPFLQNTLEGWRYLQLSQLLEYELPVTSEITQKIEGEQLEIYKAITQAEEKLKVLTRERDVRLGLVKATEGVIHHGSHIELTDERIERFKYKEEIEVARARVVDLVKKAIRRGYHENGRTINRPLDVGVTQIIHLKEFFYHRKAELKL